MKVLLVNGSHHDKGCTYTALAEVAKACMMMKGSADKVRARLMTARERSPRCSTARKKKNHTPMERNG